MDEDLVAMSREQLIATLVVAFAAAMLLAWTAYLGGRINHPELRDNAGATAFRHELEWKS